MQYRAYPGVGRVSQLGFGCMRFTMDKNNVVHRQKAIRLVRAAYRAGITYFDSAYGYREGQSDVILGEAVRPFRDDVTISTKIMIHPDTTPKSWREMLDTQLKRFHGPVDIMNAHNLRWEVFQKRFTQRRGFLAAMRKAQAEGLFKHLAVSSHDTPENIIRLLDTGEFVGVTLQYNLLDRRNEPVIEHARKKGLGVIVMGPVAGGRLAAPSKRLLGVLGRKVKSTPELALRFVLSNTNVTAAISGMTNLKVLRENVAIASRKQAFSADERRRVRQALKEIQKLSRLYCTACGYCMPCPHGVNIPRNFELMNLHRIWEIKEFAQNQYAAMTRPGAARGLNAGFCKACGACMPKCPQNIRIVGQLREVAAALGGNAPAKARA